MSDKVAIITGAGSGIGKELARALTWLGAKVVIAEINDNGKDIEDLIRSEGGNAIFIKTDVSNKRHIDILEKKVIETYGKVDILINNAYTTSVGTVLEISMEEWDKIYNVNIRGAIYAIKTFLPYMIKQNEGVINTLTSAEGWPYMAPYFATKTALTSIAKSLASELDETNISVFAFGPGMVDTPGFQEYSRILAPKYGMTEEEFKNQGVNPGYKGLMPADHCAAGWAYTIVHAKEYHGQIAEPFSPLLKLGILKTENERINSNQKIFTEDEISNLILQTKENSEIVYDIIENVKLEIKQLGLFAKKWMDRTFSNRCGINVSKSVDMMSELKNKVQNLIVNSGRINNNLDIMEGISWYIEVLKKIASYFNTSKDDAKGWIKDPKELKVALETLENREQSVHNLISNLIQFESQI